MPLTTSDLMGIARLNSDGVLGFEAQVALRTARVEADWPEHLRETRVDNFRRGSLVARRWMEVRRAVGGARRKIRAREARENGGMMPVLSPGTASEAREEQLETLREVMARLDRAEAAAAAEGAAREEPEAPVPPGP